MTTTPKVLARPKLAEVASRIDAHLTKFEADRDGVNKSHDGREGGLRPFYRNRRVRPRGGTSP